MGEKEKASVSENNQSLTVSLKVKPAEEPRKRRPAPRKRTVALVVSRFKFTL